MKYYRLISEFNETELNQLKRPAISLIKEEMIAKILSDLEKSDLLEPVQLQTHPDYPVKKYEISFYAMNQKTFSEMVDIIVSLKMNATDDIQKSRLNKLIDILNKK